MAYQLMGSPAQSYENYVSQVLTHICTHNPAPTRGILKTANFYPTSYADGTAKIKVFRDDGTNFIYIGQSPAVNVTKGIVNTIPCWIPVEVGDYIGIYTTSCRVSTSTTGGAICYYKVGDITSDSLKSSWSNSGSALWREAYQGNIFSKISLFSL